MSYREELRPPVGFTILSSGEVLRSHDTRTFDEDMVARGYAQWMVMKAMGCFDRPKDEAVEEHEMQQQQITEDMDEKVESKPEAGAVSSKDKKKNKKKKTNQN